MANMYAWMSSNDDKKWDRGWYYFPVFQFGSDYYVIMDLEKAMPMYVLPTQHSMDLEEIVTREHALMNVCAAIVRHLKKGKLRSSDLTLAKKNFNLYKIQDILAEGGTGISIPYFVMDDGLLFDAICRVENGFLD